MKKIIFTLFIVAGLFNSCNVLDLDPLDSYNPESVFADDKLTEIFVNQRYPEIRHGFSTPLRWICDETFAQHNGAAQTINAGGMTPDQTGGHDLWSYYSPIRHCNIFFENIDKLPVDNVERKAKADRMRGEMHFLRGYFYFDLTTRYNGVPLIKRPLNQDDDLMLPRNSYEECMEFVIEEFEKAAELLPYKQTGDDFGRATKGAALAYKARALLYMASPLFNPSNDRSKWQAAADATKAVIDLKDDSGNLVYELDTDYAGLFLNNKSKEIIFQRIFTSEFGHYTQQYELPSGYGESWASSNVTQELVDAYEMKDGKLPTDPTSSYDLQNPYADREPRFYASILYDGAPFKGREVECWVNANAEDIFNSGLDSDKNPIGDWNASRTRYTMRKFMDESIPTGQVFCPQPWIYMRFAEMYLNYAEAMYQLGEESTCREYLNIIRHRARSGQTDVLPDITVSGEALWQKVINERRIELAFEEHRYWDVRRWKIADVTENITIHRMMITKDLSTGIKTYAIDELQTRRFYSQHYFFPIPRSEMEKDPNLEQNTGYQ